MSRSYWRVTPAFWGDEKVAGWNDDTRLLALYLLTCEHRTLEGLFRLPKGYILADLGWTEERLAEPFAQLLREGFIEYDATVRVCLLVNALAYQSPENPNQVLAAMKVLEPLPATRLFTRLLSQAQRFCKPLAERLAERFPERLGEGLGKPPALTPALSPIPKEEAAVVAHARDAVENRGGGFDEESTEDDPLLWDLWEVPGWPRDDALDRKELTDVKRDYARANLSEVIADLRAAGNLQNPRKALRAFAKKAHERAPTERRPNPLVLPAVPALTPEQRKAQVEAAAAARRQVEAMAAGVRGVA
jgi:hypothetical protein